MTWLATPTTMMLDYNAEDLSQEVLYISTSENSSIRKVSRARGKRTWTTSHVYHVGAARQSVCAPNQTPTRRLRGFRRSRDTLAPSWYAGGSSWKTNYMVLMNLAGPEARRNFTTTSDSPACCGQPYNLPDPTGLLYHTVLLFQYVISLCHSLDILWSSSLN